MKFQSRVWKFGDNINTDLILPIQAFYLTPAEQAQWVFRANRPGWSEQVQPGDIIIGGRNFGMGSSRPAARSLKNLGIGCLVAHSINGLFFRNCVNGGYLVPCESTQRLVEEIRTDDECEVDLDKATLVNKTTGKSYTLRPLGDVAPIIEAGGVFEYARKSGMLAR